MAKKLSDKIKKVFGFKNNTPETEKGSVLDNRNPYSIAIDVNSCINDVTVTKTTITVHSCLLFSNNKTENASNPQIDAYLFNEKNGSYIPLATESSDCPEGIGFNITFDIEQVHTEENINGKSCVLLKYEDDLYNGTVFLGNPINEKIAEKVYDNTIILNDNIIRLGMNESDMLTVDTLTESVFVAESSFKHDLVRFTLERKAKKVFAKDDCNNIIYFETDDGLTFYSMADFFYNDTDYKLFITKENGETDFLSRRSKAVNIKGSGKRVAILRSNKTLRMELKFISNCTAVTQMQLEDTSICFETKALGKNSALKEAIYATLVFVEDDGETVIPLTRSLCSLNERGKTICSFKIDFANRELTDKLNDVYQLVYTDYALEDGTLIRQPLLCQKYFKYSHSFNNKLIEMYRYEGYGVRLRTENVIEVS